MGLWAHHHSIIDRTMQNVLVHISLLTVMYVCIVHVCNRYIDSTCVCIHTYVLRMR